MRNLIFFLLLVVIIAVIIWWVTSENFTAAVSDGIIQYNEDSSSFSRFFFKLDCAIVRSGAYDSSSLTCNINQ